MAKMFKEVENREQKIKEKEENLKNEISSSEKNNVVVMEDFKKLEIKLKGAEKKNKWLWKTITKLKEDKSDLKQQLKEEKDAAVVMAISPVKPSGEGDGEGVSYEEYNEVLKKLKLARLKNQELIENRKEKNEN